MIIKETTTRSLDNWNVYNVPNMHCMFRDATNFNQPLNNWDVTNMNSMFKGATSLINLLIIGLLIKIDFYICFINILYATYINKYRFI